MHEGYGARALGDLTLVRCRVAGLNGARCRVALDARATCCVHALFRSVAVGELHRRLAPL